MKTRSRSGSDAAVLSSYFADARKSLSAGVFKGLQLNNINNERNEKSMQLDQIRFELPNISAGLKEVGESL